MLSSTSSSGTPTLAEQDLLLVNRLMAIGPDAPRYRIHRLDCARIQHQFAGEKTPVLRTRQKIMRLKRISGCQYCNPEVDSRGFKTMQIAASGLRIKHIGLTFHGHGQLKAMKLNRDGYVLYFEREGQTYIAIVDAADVDDYTLFIYDYSELVGA